MKIIKYSALIALILFTVGCSLEEEIFDSATPDSAIVSVSDIDNALTGAYASINNISGFGREAMWLTHSYADDLSCTAGNEPGIIGRKVTLNSGFPLYNNLWVNFYRGISNSNGVISYLRNLELDADYELRADSEAKFLRGFYYFNLVQLYGGVPLVTKVVDASDNFYIPRNTVDQVYAQIFSDFLPGTENLPTRSQLAPSESGRATKGAAQGYLAKAYLTYANYLDLNGRSAESAQYYQLAEDFADDVILSGEYQLVSDYAVLWDVNKESEAAQEILFSSVNTRDSANPSNGGEGAIMPFFFAPNSLPNSTGRPDGTGVSFYKVQPWFFKKYTEGVYANDYRVDASFLYSWNDLQNRNRTVFPFIPTDRNERQAYMAKYLDGAAIGNFGAENDFYLLRYSEIFMIKAEAENELNGPTTDAITAFNKLRARARLADGTPRIAPADIGSGLTKEEFRMAIFDERGLEFIAEYNRFFDLIRMRYLDNTTSMYEYQYKTFIPTLPSGLPVFANGSWSGGLTEPSNVVPFDAKYMLFPIPANQRAINPKLSQNPDW